MTTYFQKMIQTGCPFIYLKAYSFFRLSVPDYSSLYPQMTTSSFKNSKKNDNVRLKPEVSGRSKISLIQANSEGSITVVEPLKVQLLAFYQLKTCNFRFKPEVSGRISKLIVSIDSACLITTISTLKLLLVCLNPLKPVTSGLNRKCVGGSQS